MPDVFDRKKRSWVMSRIRSKTKFEEDFLKHLSAELYPRGYRYRKHYKKLPGTPDIVFVRYRLVVFLDGDFWHGRELKKLIERPISDYWVEKIKKNKERDRRHNRELRTRGWKVLRIWEHDVKKDPQKVIRRIEKQLQDNSEDSSS